MNNEKETYTPPETTLIEFASGGSILTSSGDINDMEWGD